MADLSRGYLPNSRSYRDRGKEKYKDRKQDSPRKKHEIDNVRSSKDSTSNSSRQYEKKLEDRNAHHSSRHWDDRRVSYRPNNKTRSSSPASQRSKHESTSEDFPNSSHNDAMVNGQRSSHDADRYNDRVTDESRFASCNNHKSDVNHDGELIASLKQQIDYLTNQVEFFYQENEKLKYNFHNVSNHIHGASNSEVTITFQDKNLERQFLPVLEELVSELICNNIGLEDLQTFLSSKRNSVENDLPEGELFALDNSTTEPNEGLYVPCYETSFNEILQDQDLMSQVDAKKDKPIKEKNCFNCSEDHMLHECPYQMDYRKVAMARKQRSRAFVPQVRYHVQGMKERNLKPGAITEELREALYLDPDQIPIFTYRMRLLNYPPGWLAEAEVETSGITLYGTDVQTDEGTEAGKPNFGSRVQYDPDKLIDFPGFNVPLPPNFIDECEYFCLPPLQEHHLRSVVEQYMPKVALPKRKRKLTVPENQPTKVQRLEEDMEVDEILENGCLEFNPPLPEEDLPPPPPEDEPQPPLPKEVSLPPLPKDKHKPPLPKEVSLPPLPNDEHKPPLPKEVSLPPLPKDEHKPPLPKEVSLPPLPKDEHKPPPPSDEQEEYTCIDSDDSGTNTPMSSSTLEAIAPVAERFHMESTPSLKDLEEMKKLLEMELENSECSSDGSVVNQCGSEPCFSQDNSNDLSSSESQSTSRQLSKTDSCTEAPCTSRQISMTESQDSGSEDLRQLSRTDSQRSGSKLVRLGTPSLSRHSSFQKLPDYDNFSKNVTTHLNFENLPSSVGTYQKMKKVIKKVKEKVMTFMQ